MGLTLAAATLISGLAAAGASAAGAAMTNQANAANSAAGRRWQERMMYKQNKLNLENWQKQNEYNSPANQMKLLREAGLNPLFQIGGGLSEASSIQGASVPMPGDIPQYVNPLANLPNLAAQMAQVANVEATTDKIKTETDQSKAMFADRLESIRKENELLNQQVVKEQLSNEAQRTFNKYYDVALNLDNQKRFKDLNLTDKQIESLQSGIEKTRYEVDKLMPKEVEKADAEIRQTESQTGLTEANTTLAKANTYKASAERINIGVDTRNKSLELKRFNLYCELLAEQVRKTAAEAGLTETEIYYYVATHMDNGVMGSGISLNNLFMHSINAGDTVSGVLGL